MTVTVAATQMACSWDRDENLAKAEQLVRGAAAAGAQIILLQEVFSSHEFQFFEMKPDHLQLAETLEGPTISHMRSLAKDLGVVIPANFFEVANNAYFNTNAFIDADGSILGIYRKSHIPLGLPGCYEKVYSNLGDTGFLAFKTAYATIGAGICWDQWFPEAARIMTLKGAEILFYPTAIGSDCHDHWETVMRGHAGANVTPLVAANRIFVHRNLYDDFVERFTAAVTGLRVGPGLQPGVDQGPLINAKAVAKAEEHVADAVRKGARLLAGGGPHALGGLFFEPTVVADVTPEMKIFREETFAPVAAILPYESEDEVVGLANDTEYGLAAYVFARDMGRICRISDALEYGMVAVNCAKMTGAPIPFGGVKQSGLGREGSRYGMDDYTELKYVCLGGIDR